jgi:L-ascorbate metabolism protein UlaG (beta-lactamase superfamily)
LPAPIVQPDLDLIHGDSGGCWLTWLGHASFLGSLGGHRFLIDPVLSSHAGWLYRRHLPAPMEITQLPEIDVIVVTHNHYDHLDEAVLSFLPSGIPTIVPEGMGRWMHRRGRSRVIELQWWRHTEVEGLRITLVPALHWSRRGVFDTNRALWGGYVIECSGRTVYHSGDTARFDGFSEIGRRFPDLEAAMLPIGAYDPAWFMEHYHLNPEQAGEAFLDLGARRLIPMHWGTFQLTDEPLCEPIELMHSWWQANTPTNSRRIEILDVGETLLLDDSPE